MRLLSHQDLRDRGIPWSKVQILRKGKAGEFPQPITLSIHRIAWVEDEVAAWMEARAAERITEPAVA